MIGQLVRKVWGAAFHTRDPADDFWYRDLDGLRPQSPIYVTPESASSVPAVRRCLEVLADPVATLPRRIFRRLSDGTKRPADHHPIADLMRSRPNTNQTAAEFFGQMQWWLGLYHNAYARIVPGQRGPVDQLVPIHPAHVRPFKNSSGTIWYQVRREDGGEETIAQDEIWHLRCYPFDDQGIAGVPRIRDAHITIGQAIALQRYAEAFWNNSGQAGGVIKHPGHFRDKEQRDEWLKSWREARSGAHAHRDALLEFGMDYVPGKNDNESSQFLETRKRLAVEIAQLWKVPPSKIGETEGIKYNSAEQQALAFVTDCLLPWLVIWEQSVNSALIINSERFFFEFNVAGLLRGDIGARYTAYAQARQWGWLSINDIRSLENMNGIGPAGDTYLEPLNMQPAGQAPLAPAANGEIQIYRSVDQYLREHHA